MSLGPRPLGKPTYSGRAVSSLNFGDRDLVEFSRQFALELFAETTGGHAASNPAVEGDNGDLQSEASPA